MIEETDGIPNGSRLNHAEPLRISPNQQRAYERARRAAMALCPGLLTPDSSRLWQTCIVDSESIERYRLLIAAMGVARGTPGGLAIAALAHRGYVVIVPVSRWPPAVRALDVPGMVWFGVGLPTRQRSWAASEDRALKVDIATLPALSFVSAHTALRVRQDLRRQGFEF
jgi:hypothetical protein